MFIIQQKPLKIKLFIKRSQRAQINILLAPVCYAWDE